MLIYRTIFQLILNAQSLKDRMKPEVFFKEELVGEGVAGMIGELIVTALMKRGVQGVIIDSGIRDVAQICDLGFPIWTKAVFSQGTTKSKGGWVNAPTVCGGVTVGPGELIMADDDGVVVVKKG